MGILRQSCARQLLLYFSGIFPAVRTCDDQFYRRVCPLPKGNERSHDAVHVLTELYATCEEKVRLEGRCGGNTLHVFQILEPIGNNGKPLFWYAIRRQYFGFSRI